MLEAFTPADLIGLGRGLGQATFVGTSGRVFPKALKASPLLRAWIARLEEQGVALNLRSTWTGWNAAGDLAFETPAGPRAVRPARHDPGLGRGQLGQAGFGRRPGAAAGGAGRGRGAVPAGQCRLHRGVDEVFRERFAGAPLKNIGLGFEGASCAATPWRRATGLEGGAVYALVGGLARRGRRAGLGEAGDRPAARMSALGAS